MKELKKLKHPVAKWIATRNRLQKRIALKLQEHSERFSIKTKKGFVLAFVLVSTALCSLPVFEFINGKLGKKPTLIPDQIVSITLENKASKPPENPALERIIAFRQYLMALENSPEGRKKKQALLEQRPGLLDSLLLVEKMYGIN